MFNFTHAQAIKNPAGTYSLVGKVPLILSLIHEDGSPPTEEQCNEIAQSVDPHMQARIFGLKTRVFESEDAARAACEAIDWPFK